MLAVGDLARKRLADRLSGDDGGHGYPIGDASASERCNLLGLRIGALKEADGPHRGEPPVSERAWLRGGCEQRQVGVPAIRDLNGVSEGAFRLRRAVNCHQDVVKRDVFVRSFALRRRTLLGEPACDVHR
jgi:hypothetical protein